MSIIEIEENWYVANLNGTKKSDVAYNFLYCKEYKPTYVERNTLTHQAILDIKRKTINK